MATIESNRITSGGRFLAKAGARASAGRGKGEKRTRVLLAEEDHQVLNKTARQRPAEHFVDPKHLKIICCSKCRVQCGRQPCVSMCGGLLGRKSRSWQHNLILLCEGSEGGGGDLLAVSPDGVVVVELFANSVLCLDFSLGCLTCSSVCHLHVLWEVEAKCAPERDSHTGSS